jgi:hypothetical protein
MLANYVKAFLLHPWLRASRGAIVRSNERQSDLSDVLKAFSDPRDAQLNVVKACTPQHAGDDDRFERRCRSSRHLTSENVGSRKESGEPADEEVLH